MKIEQRMDVDCIWQVSEPTVEPTHLLVYHQEEHGHATAMAGKGIIGDAEPIACLFSKLMETPSVNYVPNPAWVEYRLYETRTKDGERFFVLRIPKAYPALIEPPPHQTNTAWLYTYPIVRDIVLILSQYGVNRMTYMTSNLFAMQPDYRHMNDVDIGVVCTYDFADISQPEFVTEHFGKQESENLGEFILAPNVWIWCHIFANFCFHCVKSEVLLGTPAPTFSDTDCADSLLNHLSIHYNLPYDSKAYTQFAMALKQMTDEKYIKLDLEDEQDETDMGDFVP
tara:strand:- start:4420 stop:5268 length:849 start_codon:yes stop_codon:yes gene_type:complete